MKLGVGFEASAGFEDYWKTIGESMASNSDLDWLAAKNLAHIMWREARCQELVRCSNLEVKP